MESDEQSNDGDQENPGTSTKNSQKRKAEKNIFNPKRQKKANSGGSHTYRVQWKKEYVWCCMSSKDKYHFHCSLCMKDLLCISDGITAVKRHSVTKEHQKSQATAKNQISIADMYRGQLDTNTRARKIELQTAIFIVRNNLQIALSDDLIDFLRKVDIDKKVQSELTCNRTKCTAIIRNVIGKHNFNQLVEILREQKFSLIIDESTDIGLLKHLVLCVRYATEEGIQDDFLTLLEVQNSTADALHAKIVEFFVTWDIPFLQNMVGFASDGANVMFGDHNSVAAKFKKQIPTLFLMKCICHSLALSVSYATKELPAELEKLLSEVYSYFKRSSKRQIGLQKFQNLLDIPEHKILKFMKVRWLSFGSCVSRFLEQFDALFDFFKTECEKEKDNVKAQEIFSLLKNRWYKHYLQFLHYILPIVNKRNIEFQSEKPKIQEIHQKMETFFKAIVGNYLNEEYVDQNDAEFIEYNEPTESNRLFWEPLRKVQLGPLLKADLACLPRSIPVQVIDAFRTRCRAFYITLASQIEKRFPFKEESVKMLKEFAFLDPSDLPNVRDISITAHFLKMDVEETHEEFKKLKRWFKNSSEKDPQKFWQKIKTTTAGDESSEFPLITEIIKKVEVFPITSADCELVFSAINRNKTKDRASLGTKTLSGILYGKNFIKKEKRTGKSTDALVKMMKENIYEDWIKGITCTFTTFVEDVCEAPS